jgi:hypothetical protein
MTTKAKKPAKRLRVCPRCGFRAMLPDDGAPMYCACQNGEPIAPPAPHELPPAPAEGPGTELKKLLADLGVTMSADCGCKAMAVRMNRWGVAGCRDNHSVVVAHLRQAAERRDWVRKWSAQAAMKTAWLAMRVNWLDPVPGLVDLAIERAEGANP